jgi:hypothetical protein
MVVGNIKNVTAEHLNVQFDVTVISLMSDCVVIKR